jgi:hypothetical protein
MRRKGKIAESGAWGVGVRRRKGKMVGSKERGVGGGRCAAGRKGKIVEIAELGVECLWNGAAQGEKAWKNRPFAKQGDEVHSPRIPLWILDFGR